LRDNIQPQSLDSESFHSSKFMRSKAGIWCPDHDV
jgi:hypothetical protein